ncbi:MAG: DUF3105 domain-containing protein [Deltaproteobacteria bacterium]|nr:DUF3105 domain-containing protein [Deltaproteobacteria bacterium]
MQRHPRLIATVFGALACVSCGSRSTLDYPILEASEPDPERPDYCGPPSGVCEVKRCDPPLRDGTHYQLCAPIDFATNPPTSGPHFPIWGLFKTYETPLARGFYLHDAEHSGVVLLYNCASLSTTECTELVSALESYVADAPADPLCVEPTRHRLLVTPDPLLDVPFAAVAWGHSLKAQCFDRDATDAFVAAYYGKNYENLCSGGIDPTDPESGIEPGCGL